MRLETESVLKRLFTTFLCIYCIYQKGGLFRRDIIPRQVLKTLSNMKNIGVFKAAHSHDMEINRS